MKFKSAVLELPPEVRTEIDSLIEKDCSGLFIYSSLKDKYGQAVQVPTVPTLLRYIKYYRLQRGSIQKQIIDERLTYNFEGGLQEVESVLVQISQNKEPSFNKTRLLEGLAAKCIQRISELEISTIKRDFRVENAIARYISEVKSIIETVTRLSGDTQKDEQVFIQLIRNESKGVLELVREIVLEIAPEKYELFKDKLKKRLQEN
jgi:hypothetical protein